MSEFRDWYNSVPFFTRYWLTATLVLSLLAKFGLVGYDVLTLGYYTFIQQFQIWRPITALFFYPITPGTGFHFLINCYFLYKYSDRLESGIFAGKPADYFYMLLFNWACCVILALLVKFPLLMDPMVISVLYVWCQLNKDVIVSFWFGTRFKAMYLPWVLLAFNLILSGGGVMELLGILIGHLSFFLLFKYPQEFGGPALLTPPAFYNFKMATSVLQPEDCRREHEPKIDIIESPRLNDDERVQILEGKERETGELPTELREQARIELREEPALREQALAQMEHFIEKHPAIKKCRTDSPFLLRFLRTKKYSIPQACSMLERYLTIRQMYPQWFQKLDPLDPKIAAVIDAGYLVPLPKRDSEGRRVVLSCMGRFDPHVYDSCVMAKVHSMIVELLLDEPRSQLLGYTHVNDEAGMQMPHVSLWSLTDVRVMLNCIQNSTPMRHKRTHFVNIPHYGIRFFEFAVSLLSDKLKDRVMFHRTSADLMKYVDPSILPKEYGGTVPLRDMIDELKRNLLKHRSELLALDDMCIDLYALEKNDLTQDIHSTAGSFRKLELD